MPLPGAEKLKHTLPQGEGSFVKLVKGQPMTVEVLEYLGQFNSKAYPEKLQHVFQVRTPDGVGRLGGGWRLAKALSDAGDTADGAFRCAITLSKVVASVNGKDMLVNAYTVTDVVPLGQPDDQGVAF